MEALTPAEADALIAEHFPLGMGRPSIPLGALVEETFPLTSAHLAVAQTHADSGTPIGVKPVDVKALRHTHHRLAQMLAAGVDETVAAKMCNYSVSRVSILKSDPAFSELLAHYSTHVEDQWADFIATAKNLSLDVLQELQARLDEKPESLTAAQLTEILKTVADRSGNAPVTRSQNVNVNLNLGDRLKLARERSASVYIEGTARVDD